MTAATVQAWRWWPLQRLMSASDVLNHFSVTIWWLPFYPYSVKTETAKCRSPKNPPSLLSWVAMRPHPNSQATHQLQITAAPSSLKVQVTCNFTTHFHLKPTFTTLQGGNASSPNFHSLLPIGLSNFSLTNFRPKLLIIHPLVLVVLFRFQLSKWSNSISIYRFWRRPHLRPDAPRPHPPLHPRPRPDAPRPRLCLPLRPHPRPCIITKNLQTAIN